MIWPHASQSGASDCIAANRSVIDRSGAPPATAGSVTASAAPPRASGAATEIPAKRPAGVTLGPVEAVLGAVTGDVVNPQPAEDVVDDAPGERNVGSPVNPAGSNRLWANFRTIDSSGKPYCYAIDVRVAIESIRPPIVEPSVDG
jgi:hypothetical protein